MIEKERRKRVNVAVRISHHQMLRHLAAAKEVTVQEILDKLLEHNLDGIDGMTLKEIGRWEPKKPDEKSSK
ncbi:MAG: hypothetical protein GY922_05485 [Proteobacteria bacterium]|jgi:hypothetical protein|nr:hypothetical protein [Pseudomonadota bacterium]